MTRRGLPRETPGPVRLPILFPAVAESYLHTECIVTHVYTLSYTPGSRSQRHPATTHLTGTLPPHPLHISNICTSPLNHTQRVGAFVRIQSTAANSSIQQRDSARGRTRATSHSPALRWMAPALGRFSRDGNLLLQESLPHAGQRRLHMHRRRLSPFCILWRRG